MSFGVSVLVPLSGDQTKIQNGQKQGKSFGLELFRLVSDKLILFLDGYLFFPHK